METLQFILGKRRSYGTEEATAKAILPHIATYFHNVKGDFMFAMVDVLTADNQTLPTTLFSSHLDTVEHRKDGHNVLTISGKGIMTVLGGGILGADDGAGLWLMVNMIDNHVTGRYMFFAGEESGGIGSKYAVDTHPELFNGFNRAIAFDRRGNKDVIVSQCVGDCASPQFGIALADALSCSDYPFDVADGVYTDTAEMIGIIPECVNVSCGYMNEHGATESLDVTFLYALLNKVINLDWESLPTHRNPVAPVRKVKSWKSTYNDRYDYLDNVYNSQLKENDDIEEIIDSMYMAGITMSDLLAYIRKTGDTDLL